LRSISEEIEKYFAWHPHKPPQDKVELLKSAFTNPSLLCNELNQQKEEKWMGHEWYPTHGMRQMGAWGNNLIRLRALLLIGLQVDPRSLLGCAWGLTQKTLRIEVTQWVSKQIGTKQSMVASSQKSKVMKRFICLPGFLMSPSRPSPACSKRRPNAPLEDTVTPLGNVFLSLSRFLGSPAPSKQRIQTPDTEPTTDSQDTTPLIDGLPEVAQTPIAMRRRLYATTASPTWMVMDDNGDSNVAMDLCKTPSITPKRLDNQLNPSVGTDNGAEDSQDNMDARGDKVS
jgi:hypothetical protein